MSLYIDTSALLKRYVAEDDSDACERIVGNPTWVTARHTWLEVLRNLAALLHGAERTRMKRAFRADWERTHIVELDTTTCERGSPRRDSAGVHPRRAASGRRRTRRRRRPDLRHVYDIRQAQAARSLGWRVVGR